MAVWIQIIGLRESDSIENDKKTISEILNNVEFDSHWVLVQSNGIEYFELSVFNQTLKIFFDNPNFIEFSGSFGLFSLWLRFTDKEQSELTNKIRKVFKKIAFDYGISELMYFSEWFFGLDEIRNSEETFEDFKKWIENNQKRKKDELFGLEANEYYVEKTSPVN